ncbi:MAG: response regulator [Butyrivibrio sp.]|nr:response regulator [Butyrivibrio sp.]
MNVLLVDDDRFVIAALKKEIDWESLGITGVFTANNISSAKEIMQSEKIDLLLSDIDMPHGTGLDLLGFIREQGNRLPAIFLTNYADFSYAKRALELRSFHYFLKPIDYSELTQIIKKALAEARGEAMDNTTRLTGLWYSYLFEKRITEKAFIQDVSDVDPAINKDSEYLICLFQGFQKKNPAESEVSEFSDAVEAMFRLRAVFESVLGISFAKRGILLPYQAEDFLVVSLIPADASGKGEGRINTLMSEIAGTLEKEFESPVRLLVSGVRKIPQLKEELESLLPLRLLPLEKDGSIIFTDESSVAALLQYVDNHFTEEMSREQLSEMFYFDPDYITKIFKRQTGMSFKNYVIEKRLSMAKRLLEETDDQIHDIALKVGYDNYSYFTRLFKKSYGLTPVEFRAKKAGV